MISYKKLKNKSKYYLYIDDDNILSQDISEYLGISFQEYIETVQSCKGVYLNKLGWIFLNEDNAASCAILLNLTKKTED